MITLGFDPDLHSSGLAIVEDNRLLMVALTHVSPRVTGMRAAAANAFSAQKIPLPMDMVERAVFEVPQVYSYKQNRGKKPQKKVDPQDLINLSLVAGSAVDQVLSAYPAVGIAYALPREWKGQISKNAHHKRICKSLGISYSTDSKDRVVPTWPSHVLTHGNITLARAQHVLDACGLALWAQKITCESRLVFRSIVGN